VSSEEQALNLLFEGDANRAMGEHSYNRVSSRSHVIFTITVESHSRLQNGSQVVWSKLNLVDLAGSERVAKTDSRGQALQVGSSCNIASDI
jgi:kinesin family protein 6/9